MLLNKKEIDKLIYLYNINKVIRYSLSRKEKHQTQSVAEHITNLLFLAYYFKDKEKTAKNLDFEKVIHIILLHDFGEVEIGDVPTSFKNGNDFKDEYKAIKQVSKKIPKNFGSIIEKVFDNYENLKDKESAYVKGLDAMDGLLYWQNEGGVKMLRAEYKSYKEFIEKETYVYNKKTKLLKDLNLEIMLKYYKYVYKKSALYPILKDKIKI